MTKHYSLYAILFFCIASLNSTAKTYFSIEFGPAWQARNDAGVPATGGTRFSLLNLGSGPFFASRVYAGYEWNERHGLRALYAPFQVSGDTTFAQNIAFAGQTFSAAVPLNAIYQFNSYRLTYRYAFFRSNSWQMHLGFTAKIRDAKIALSQGALRAESSNVGFVPLLHFAAAYSINEDMRVSLDVDGLAAPQGRALDATMQISHTVFPWLDAFAGYRTVEGGAENTTVYTFAWIHFLTVGATIQI